jgi:hypothetical protein
MDICGTRKVLSGLCLCLKDVRTAKVQASCCHHLSVIQRILVLSLVTFYSIRSLFLAAENEVTM